MRSVAAPTFLKATMAVLESSVVPGVADPAALRKLLICIGLLDNLIGRIEDRRSFVIDEAAMLRTLVEPTVALAAPDTKLREPAHELRECRLAVSTRLRASRAVDSVGSPLVSEEWLRRCHVVLSAINSAEMARLRPTRYARANSVGVAPNRVDHA